MEFRGDGWVVRWAYFREQYPPSRTTLCELFWRCVLVTPVKALAVVLFVFVVTCGAPTLLTFIVAQLVGWELALLIVLPTAELLMVSVLQDDAREQMATRLRNITSSPTLRNISEFADLIGGTASAVKQKVCPIVRIR